jgi:hypothetical protein
MLRALTLAREADVRQRLANPERLRRRLNQTVAVGDPRDRAGEAERLFRTIVDDRAAHAHRLSALSRAAYPREDK